MASLLTGTPLTYNGIEAVDYIIRPALATGQLEDYFKLVYGVKVKQQVIFTNPVYKITKLDPGCGTGVSNPTVTRSQKYWQPVDMKAWLDQCWSDLKGTLEEAKLKAGNDKSDLTNTDIERFILDLIEPAAYSDVLRVAWLGNTAITAAELTGGSGDVANYNQMDGFFKLITTAVGASLIPRYTIAKNAAAAGAQALAAGEAVTILGTTDRQSKPVMKQVEKSKKVYYVSRSVYENLESYYESNNNLESNYVNLKDGQSTLMFRGIPLVIVDVVDQFREADFNLSGKITLPHFAILTVRDNFQLGVDGDSFDPTALEVWYERKDEKWNGRLKYKLAAMIALEEYVSVAY